MGRGLGSTQRAILDVLNEPLFVSQDWPAWRSVRWVAVDVYGVNSDEITEAQNVAVRRALHRLVGEGLVERRYRRVSTNWRTGKAGWTRIEVRRPLTRHERALEAEVVSERDASLQALLAQLEAPSQ